MEFITLLTKYKNTCVLQVLFYHKEKHSMFVCDPYEM